MAEPTAVSAVFFYSCALGSEKNCPSRWKRGLSDEEQTGSCELQTDGLTDARMRLLSFITATSMGGPAAEVT